MSEHTTSNSQPPTCQTPMSGPNPQPQTQPTTSTPKPSPQVFSWHPASCGGLVSDLQSRVHANRCSSSGHGLRESKCGGGMGSNPRPLSVRNPTKQAMPGDLVSDCTISGEVPGVAPFQARLSLANTFAYYMRSENNSES